MPEPIVQQEGSEKNDGERNAAKRSLPVAQDLPTRVYGHRSDAVPMRRH